MTDMVTRVAEAIARKLQDEGVLDVYGVDLNGIARAAIEAMREPTKAMLDAVSEEEERQGYVAAAYESMDAESAWPVMIDAALKDNAQ